MNKLTKKYLHKLYYEDKKSIRKIAHDLGVGKTTIEYYFKKYNISRRTISQAGKLHAKDTNWIKGLTKEKDFRVKRLSNNIKIAYDKKRLERIKYIEGKYGKSLKDVLTDLYWTSNLSQEQISKEIGYDRKIIIDLMNEYKIPKRPKYTYISSLKGEKHALYGKSWEEISGKDNASKRKKIHSERFRKLSIRRLENNEFPYFDTKIEIKLANELLKQKIPFIKQFKIDNKFVCDFAIPSYNIIIECDGDFWHANPKFYNSDKLSYQQKKNLKRDRFKDIYLTKKGWKILRFYEVDIKNNIKNCINVINKAIIDKKEELKKIKSPIDSLIEK
ncbi:hypothetical protein COU57_02310 [Candidatus Pacearchaeota archaeon CG10_big_fil_rev_8_21_14_0_10_32_14]|nr:MAG: hypothetical protein COU57_02310 [Candidatus Pacearchaeota archaeon CG10_big_fil_rev_8_21_14_0_10_32_14]